MPAPNAVPKSSSMEKCSFVSHLIILAIGFATFLWILLSEDALEGLGITYYPPKEWSVHMPVSALLLFLAAPILYSAANSLVVPDLASTDTLYDKYTRLPTETKANLLAKDMATEATLPEICDLDPASLVWYPNSSTA